MFFEEPDEGSLLVVVLGWRRRSDRPGRFPHQWLDRLAIFEVLIEDDWVDIGLLADRGCVPEF